MLPQLSVTSLEGIIEEATNHSSGDENSQTDEPYVDPFIQLGRQTGESHLVLQDGDEESYVDEVQRAIPEDESYEENASSSERTDEIDMGYEDMRHHSLSYQYGDEELSSARALSSSFQIGFPANSSVAARRSSKRQSIIRRVSTESEQTSQSAPGSTEESDLALIVNENASTQRRVTVHGRTDSGSYNSSLSPGTRSNRFRISSRYTGGNDRSNGTVKSSFVSTLINRRVSTRQDPSVGGTFAVNQSIQINSGASATTMADAVERLNSYQSSDFEYVSAAAAVVAASTQNPGKRNFVQFGQGDHVLVILALLGLADSGGDKELYTIDPVNAYGYPRGEGKTEAQTQGPFLFVICVVTQVHFDEDERYYTVRRCDTGFEQRADPGFMEPIREIEAIEVAYNASQRTKKSMADQQKPTEAQSGFCKRWIQSLLRLRMNLARRVIPAYIRSRNVTKIFIQHSLHGEPGWALHLRFSGINFLVACSLIFLFHDVFALAFLSTSHDFAIDVMGLVVWVVLVVELFLEFLIRPKNYQELVHTDKAFAPSTARLLNRFHFVCESLALVLYIPQSVCGFLGQCSSFDASQRSIWALTGNSEKQAAFGRLLLGLTFLRSFGLARHWKQMWLNHTYEKYGKESSLVRRLLFVEKVETSRRFFRRKKNDEYNTAMTQDSEQSHSLSKSEPVTSEEDQQLQNAATIGTALMLVNSHRALFILICILCVFPVLFSDMDRNPVTHKQVHLLQSNNVVSNTTDDCEYLFIAVQSWLQSSVKVQTLYHPTENSNPDVRLQWAQLLPIRCDWQRADGVITTCGVDQLTLHSSACDYWESTITPDPNDATVEYFADELGIRPGGIVKIVRQTIAPANFDGSGSIPVEFFVRALYNESHAITLANVSLFMLLSSMVLFGLIGLTVMRSDSERLVLSPLHRMLSIVVRYAENPLSTPSAKAPRRRNGSSMSQSDEDDAEEQLGHYETEQLINAISKIADLLRKCWGVAGAGIISSNLARTKDGRTVVFNPTIPGKQVYALFGFIGINDFSKQLRSLEQDVMILINDVARVVHDEVYRWSLGDSGQCNKNLGAAFLMVFRIGDFMEVHDKKKRATDVVFDSQLKIEKTRQRHGSTMARRLSNSKPFELGHNGTLQLASLPGIQTFADRALLGCLKSFAGLHRDQNMQEWQKDFRLGAGVGSYHISVIYGMDAGWAVEGAVGSEYKIDATYLSPHVNMASRMMSACKQYGVKVLLSQAVEELLSKTARSKLRHLDTVFVKGSNVAQRIYTYDARHEGVDFFLFERTPDQADIEAEAYNPSIWDNDQDLKSMRQHVTDEFMKKFHQGVEQYLEGQWTFACTSLEAADNMMFEAVLEQGYVDYITEDYGEYGKNLKISKNELCRLKNEFGDGACKCLIQYMQRRNLTPPSDWNGVRHLMSK